MSLPQKIPCLPQNTSTSTTAASRWQAVVKRDATATTFVYAVITTRIYCRPSCPSRLARRANVQFYDKPSQAEDAGFRPCKRCKPETPAMVNNPQVQVVHKACQTIKFDVAAGSKPTLLKLASEAGLTPSHFHRVFKKVTGVTPGKYIANSLGGDIEKPLVRTGHDAPVYPPQPWGVGTVDEPCLLDELEFIDPLSAGNTELWNDFDVLIAAETEFMAIQNPYEPSTSGSSSSLVFADPDTLFVGGLARAGN